MVGFIAPDVSIRLASLVVDKTYRRTDCTRACQGSHADDSPSFGGLMVGARKECGSV